MGAAAHAEPGGFQVDRGWLMAYLGSVQVVYMDGRVDDAAFRRYRDALVAEIDERDPERRVGVFYHVPEPAAMSAQRRTMIAEALKEREEVLRHSVSAYALATSSAMVRGGLRVMFWMAPPPYPNRVVSTPEAGFDFIARHQEGVDPAALTTRYEALLLSSAEGLEGP